MNGVVIGTRMGSWQGFWLRFEEAREVDTLLLLFPCDAVVESAYMILAIDMTIPVLLVVSRNVFCADIAANSSLEHLTISEQFT